MCAQSESGGTGPREVPAPTGTDRAAQMHTMLCKLWESNRALIEERVEEMSSAVRALTSDPGDATARKQGGSAAHKLAGVLGTFGLQEGTEIARRAEQSLSDPAGLDRGSIAELSSAVEALRTMIAAKQRATNEPPGRE